MKNILIVLLLASTAVAQTPNPTTSPMPSPAASPNGTASPDNTKRNAPEQLTAEDQGGSATDRDMTKKIRQSVVKTDGLSSMAKNIKVITIDGKVTLRGPVHSEQEKMTINSLAEKAAGKGKVTNELEVKKSH